jgi:CheY-like chemotaxis protein
MKLNEELFKTLNILYIGNDELIKKEFSELFNNISGNLFLCSSGLAALEYFFKNQNSDNQIDVIICETILPDLDSLDILLKIREISKNIPFLFIDETFDKEFILNSLKYGVTDYFLKPIDEMQILNKIEKSSLSKRKEDEIFQIQNDIEEYLELINKVAIVFMFDSNKNIFYVNDFFKELIKYDEEDLIGEDYRRFLYEVPKAIIEEQNTQILNGNKWQGKMKFLSSINSVFYTNSTIVPIFNKNQKIRKKICISFLTTRDENEKREFRKRVFFNLQETKRIYASAQRKIDELNNILETFSDFDYIEKSLEKEKKENIQKHIKLEELEMRVKDIKNKNDFLTYGLNKKINEISTITIKINNIAERADKKIVKIEQEVKIKESQISKLEEMIQTQSSTIRELEQLLKNKMIDKENINV